MKRIGAYAVLLIFVVSVTLVAYELIRRELLGEQATAASLPDSLWSPQPESPADGIQLYASDVFLRWNWPLQLPENQFFTVRLWREGEPPMDISWTKENVADVQWLLDSLVPGRFYWQVAVIQTGEDGGFERMASAWSPVWSFERIPPTPSPTIPVPTSTPGPDPIYTDPDPYNRPAFDIESLLDDLQSLDDVLMMREQVIKGIWGDDGMPLSRMPTQVELSADVSWSDELSGLASLDRLTLSMDFGIESYFYLLHPLDPNNRLIVLHEGHQDLNNMFSKASFFLEHEYTVLLYEMPLWGANTRPVVDLPSIGRVRLTTHHTFEFVQTMLAQGSILQFFLDPVIVGLNYAQSQGYDEPFAMAGISGGGWTTTMIAAVDTRIRRAYPIAGTQPYFVRFDSGQPIHLGDYEQHLPGVLPVAEYLDLIVLGAVGDDRRQIMTYIQYDTSEVVRGVRYRSWYDTVRNRIENLDSGYYDVFLDTTVVAHTISPATLEVILTDLTDYP